MRTLEIRNSAVSLSAYSPSRGSYRSFATFSDLDGNGWLLQEITTRHPGRIDLAETSFNWASDLVTALRRAAAAHGQHEKRIGHPRRELARLVRRAYGGRAGRRGASAMNHVHLI